jgi:hypothetical protein
LNGCGRKFFVGLGKLSNWKTEGKTAKLLAIKLAYSSAFYLFIETRNGQIDGETIRHFWSKF